MFRLSTLWLRATHIFRHYPLRVMRSPRTDLRVESLGERIAPGEAGLFAAVLGEGLLAPLVPAQVAGESLSGVSSADGEGAANDASAVDSAIVLEAGASHDELAHVSNASAAERQDEEEFPQVGAYLDSLAGRGEGSDSTAAATSSGAGQQGEGVGAGGSGTASLSGGGSGGSSSPFAPLGGGFGGGEGAGPEPSSPPPSSPPPSSPPPSPPPPPPTLIGAIGDRVWLDVDQDGIQNLGEQGLSDVTVRLLDANEDVVATTISAADGAYQFLDVAPGTYSVEFVAPVGHAFSPKDQGSDDTLDSDANALGRTDVFSLIEGQTITDLDAGLSVPMVAVVASDPAASEVGSDVGTLTFSRDGDASGELTVWYLLDGTATQGSDYGIDSAVNPASVTFAPGQTQRDVVVTPIQDPFAEGDETVIVTLIPAPAGEFALGSANAATIVVHDTPHGTVVADEPNASETGPIAGSFLFARTGDLSQGLTVGYAVGGTATSSDYAETLGGTVTFAPGQSEVAQTITPLADDPDAGETVEVALLPDLAGGYRLGDSSLATVTIDAPIAVLGDALVSVHALGSPPWLVAPAGEAVTADFAFTRTGSTDYPLTIYHHAGTTDTSGPSDFSAVIPAGETSVTVTVTVPAGPSDLTQRFLDVRVAPESFDYLPGGETRVVLPVYTQGADALVGATAEESLYEGDPDAPISATFRFERSAAAPSPSLAIAYSVESIEGPAASPTVVALGTFATAFAPGEAETMATVFAPATSVASPEGRTIRVTVLPAVDYLPRGDWAIATMAVQKGPVVAPAKVKVLAAKPPAWNNAKDFTATAPAGLTNNKWRELSNAVKEIKERTARGWVFEELAALSLRRRPNPNQGGQFLPGLTHNSAALRQVELVGGNAAAVNPAGTRSIKPADKWKEEFGIPGAAGVPEADAQAEEGTADDNKRGQPTDDFNYFPDMVGPLSLTSGNKTATLERGVKVETKSSKASEDPVKLNEGAKTRYQPERMLSGQAVHVKESVGNLTDAEMTKAVRTDLLVTRKFVPSIVVYVTVSGKAVDESVVRAAATRGITVYQAIVQFSEIKAVKGGATVGYELFVQQARNLTKDGPVGGQAYKATMNDKFGETPTAATAGKTLDQAIKAAAGGVDSDADYAPITRAGEKIYLEASK